MYDVTLLAGREEPDSDDERVVATGVARPKLAVERY